MTTGATSGTASAAHLSVSRPPEIGTGRRALTTALIAHEPAQAEAIARLLLAQGHGMPELFDQVLLPLLDQQAERVARGQDTPAGLRALSHAMARLVARLPPPAPAAAAPQPRGAVVLAALEPEGCRLTWWVLSTALEHQGYAAFVVGDVPVAELVPFVLAQQGEPVVVLVADAAPADLPAARTSVRRLRAEVPGLRVVVAGRGVRDEPGLSAALAVDGAADGAAATVRLVDTLLQPLTTREIQTLQLVAGGRTNRQIATALGVAPSTVKSSLDRVFDKLATPDRAAAAATAVRRGWID